MSHDDVITLIEHEQLGRWAVLGHPGNNVDSVALWREDDAWHVASTGERAEVIAQTTLSDESEARELFIRDLRLAAREWRLLHRNA